MSWHEVVWAALLAAMLVFVFPHARRMLRESREGSAREWLYAVVPLVAVALFVILLIQMV